MNAVNDQQSRAIQPSTAIWFPLGHIVATPGALDVLERGEVDASLLLQRHQRGYWGSVRVRWRMNARLNKVGWDSAIEVGNTMRRFE